MTVQPDGQAKCDGCGALDGALDTNLLVPGWTRRDLPTATHAINQHFCPECSKKMLNPGAENPPAAPLVPAEEPQPEPATEGGYYVCQACDKQRIVGDECRLSIVGLFEHPPDTCPLDVKTSPVWEEKTPPNPLIVTHDLLNAIYGHLSELHTYWWHRENRAKVDEVAGTMLAIRQLWKEVDE